MKNQVQVDRYAASTRVICRAIGDRSRGREKQDERFIKLEKKAGAEG